MILGDTYVDLIKSMESSGTNVPGEQSKKTDHEIEVAVKDQKKAIPMKATPSSKKTISLADSKSEAYEEYFSAVRSVEKERVQFELADSEMNRYLSFLHATKLERELGLTCEEIFDIRKKVVCQTPITDMPILQESVIEGIIEEDGDEEH